jgi:uncharacterized protein YbbC (DUF1343 family)
MRLSHLFIVVIFPLISCASVKPVGEKEILPGIFQMDSILPILKGKSVGLVANQASQINGVHLVDTLILLGKTQNAGIKIKKIFSPEHGFSGVFEAGKIIENEEQEYDSIQIVSLYGKNRSPEYKDLDGIDIVVFDLQDVGVRFYTYISTLHYVMQACAKFGIPLIVLDRPNPHTHYVDGPVLEDKYKSFVGMHPVPIVYGMTIGEYAQMINGEGWLGEGLKCDLKIIPIANYKRFSVYNFPSKPSPNLPNMQSVILYPSLCLFEGTAMSVGRGTDFPFQVLGHPNYKNKVFSFKPHSKPGACLYPKFEDETCYGLDFTGISLDTLRKTTQINIHLLLNAYADLNIDDAFFTDYFKLLAGTDVLQKQIVEGFSEKEIRESWKPGLKKFMEIREKYLIYAE